MRVSVENTRIEYVYRQLSMAQAESVIQLWLAEGVLDMLTAGSGSFCSNI